MVRNYLYKKDILKSSKPNAYIVSVGNLTTGGTGKTPITAEIAKYFAEQGYKTAILSRGYGGKLSNKNVNIISDGETIFFNPIDSGDEPNWLAQNCKGVYVLTCSSRVKAAEYAYRELGCARIVLDDGFQHRKLERDKNILVVDASKKFSNGCLLPAGALRESVTEVQRADVIVVTNKSFDDRAAKTYARYLRKTYKKPAVVCSLVPDFVYNLKDGLPLSDDYKQNPAVIAFSAIGQPEQFYSLLRRYDIIETVDFPDHHIYTEEDIQKLFDLKQKYDADLFITTEKDAVKLKELKVNLDNFYALKLKPDLNVEEIFALGEN